MDDYNVNIFNQNYILTKMIKILVEKYSLLKYDKRSLFGMLPNHNLDNDTLFKNLSGIKISRILFDNKILDNIKKVIVLKYSVKKKLNKNVSSKISNNIRYYKFFIYILKNNSLAKYSSENYTLQTKDKIHYTDKRIIILNYYHK
jgi:hypothetical protein